MGHYCTGYRLFLRKRANLTKEIQNLAGPRGKLRVARIVNLNLPEFSERDFSRGHLCVQVCLMGLIDGPLLVEKNLQPTQCLCLIY